MKSVETINNDDNITIKINGNLSTFVFYNAFMVELSAYINRNNDKKKPPIISIENVSWIDSNVLPCLISVGLILKRYYGTAIYLQMAYNPSLLQYLETSEFLLWIGKRLDIFTYDEELIGGFNLYVSKYNSEYKLEKFKFISGYYEADEFEKTNMKFSLLDRLERHDVPRIFGTVLKTVMDDTSEAYNMCNQAIAEIVCNSMLYSESDAFACVQALPNGVHISLSDLGIGFKKSLERKGVELQKQELSMKLKINNLIDNKILEDFFAIFLALKHAENTGRVNLWKLKNIITDKEGTIRIHNNRIQLIFSHKRCSKCKKNSVNNCMNCMIENFSTNYRLSPLRVYKAKIEGVHIEIDIVRGDKNYDFNTK